MILLDQLLQRIGGGCRSVHIRGEGELIQRDDAMIDVRRPIRIKTRNRARLGDLEVVVGWRSGRGVHVQLNFRPGIALRR